MLIVQEQIYGLSQIWSEAKYNFVFWHMQNDLDWDEAYQKVLEKVMHPMETIDYYLELMRLTAQLNDGHSFVLFPKQIYSEMKSLPLKIKFVNNKHIVVNRSKNLEIPLFSEILEINGMNFDAYMNEKVFPYCWHAKPSSSYEQLYVFNPLAGDVDKNAYAFIPILERHHSIELKTSAGVYNIVPTLEPIEWDLPITLKSSEPLNDVFHSEGLMIRLTSDNIAVITLPTFMDDEMPKNFYKHLERLSSCKGFVIDVRNNGGGHSENADALSQAFINGPFDTGKNKYAIHIGAYKAWGKGNPNTREDLSDTLNKRIDDMCNHILCEEEITTAHYPDCPVTFKQPVVILENAFTASSAENLLINFDSNKRATIIGTPSYGSTGNILANQLPGGGILAICTVHCSYPDGKEMTNIGIMPHIHKELSSDDLKNGLDSILDEGLSEIRRQNENTHY